jgi:hypothetical protein
MAGIVTQGQNGQTTVGRFRGACSGMLPVISAMIVCPVLLLYETGFAGECLDIHLSCNKDTYLRYEPIVVNYEIENRGQTSISTIYHSYGEYFVIHDDNGLQYANTMYGYFWSLPDTLKPREIYSGWEKIETRDKILSPGTYACWLNIPKDLYYPACDTVVCSDTITFRVEEPIGAEQEALMMYLHADSLHWAKGAANRKAAVAEFYALAEQFPNSVYSAHALFWTVLMKDAVDDISTLVATCKRIIENYDQSPFLEETFTNLMDNYNVMKDKAEADQYLNSLIIKYPTVK